MPKYQLWPLLGVTLLLWRHRKRDSVVDATSNGAEEDLVAMEELLELSLSPKMRSAEDNQTHSSSSTRSGDHTTG